MFDHLPHRHGARRLTRFLALSAALHALVITGLPLFPDRPSADPATLRLALAQPQAMNPPGKAPVPTPHRKTEPLRDFPAPVAPVTPVAPVPPVDAAAPVASPAPPVELAAPGDTPAEESTARDAAASARVLAQVRIAFARYFTYPLFAQRQGWQGEVLLGFSVSPEGHIDQVKVVRSSGHELLDEAARESLARVGNLPGHVAPGGAPLHLQLPVIYRLAEG